jgi:ketosteroid isomerase-like protein
MANGLAQRFIEALQAAEESGQVDPLLPFFGEDAELRRQTGDAPQNGQEGARRFWQEYLSGFKRIRSTFTNVIEADNTAVLEWVSDAEPATGPSFQYAGVSVLEGDGERVRKFRTYYDSAKFVPVTGQEGQPGARRG